MTKIVFPFPQKVYAQKRQFFLLQTSSFNLKNYGRQYGPIYLITQICDYNPSSCPFEKGYPIIIRLVWGDDHVVSIKIPTLINDYNMWMLGVDLVGQLITYYRPKICCGQTWMPLLLHCLDIIQVNSYVLYNETSYLHPLVENDEIDSHKRFLIEFVNSLIR